MSLIAIVIGLLTMTAFAQTKNKGLIGQQVEQKEHGYYGMSGCGLGSILFGESENKVSQVLSAITNDIYSNNTFGMSSGTSNCIPEKGTSSAAVKMNVEKFVVANREALANDIVKSNGETVVAMSEILGCKDSEYLSTKLQSRYETIFNTKNDTTVANNMWNTVSTDRYLVENCKL
jgi:hypothetical protein